MLQAAISGACNRRSSHERPGLSAGPSTLIYVMSRICCHESMLGLSQIYLGKTSCPAQQVLRATPASCLLRVADLDLEDFPQFPIFGASTQTLYSVILIDNMSQLYRSESMEEVELSQTSSRQGDDEKRNAERKKAPNIVVFMSMKALWATFIL